jgi:hypothetical protein
MAFYTLYKLSDGAAVSNSSQQIVNPDSNIYGIAETADNNGVWDTVTKLYVTPPVRSILVSDFLDRFTAAEQSSLFSKKDTVSNIGLFFYKIPMYKKINLDDSIWQVAVNWLENNGHIAAGRAAEVLADG